ncbi:hypothetical protein B4U80_05721 [Leptotrombidium deliense]|uniref:F-box domain-containing protein n=1 Tax=Leptotrombidium deliense TaxID=299467 RepID=A0A443SV34_9ACAR|nr:hypothetical protein B4U80_05721 [Leptotrombidium deliense]
MQNENIEFEEQCLSANSTQTSITDIPEVLLEYIFTYLPTYGRLLNCQLVCKTWKRCVEAAIETGKREFKNALRSGVLEWMDYHTNAGPNISGRYSHSCCLHDGVMYIFGGCTVANTTFNDLWTFDLSERQWIRPLVTGNYPPPKACATLVKHKDSLILFGVSDEVMQNTFVPSNEVWVFNFDCLRWRNQHINSPKPPPRYGHSQVVVDDNNILIFGGCGGPNMLFSDVWLLTLNADTWTWKEIEVKLAAGFPVPVIGFNPACKVDDLVVFLNKSQMIKSFESLKESPMIRKATERNQYSPHSVSRPSSSSNRLQPQPSKQERKQQLLGETSKPSIRPNARHDRQRQLQFLDKMEQRIKELKSSNAIMLPTVRQQPQRSKEFMSVCILDIKEVLTGGYVRWLTHEKQTNGPQEKKLYSLVPTSSELVMFGGIQKNNDADSQTTDVVSNTVHIASFRRTAEIMQ